MPGNAEIEGFVRKSHPELDVLTGSAGRRAPELPAPPWSEAALFVIVLAGLASLMAIVSAWHAAETIRTFEELPASVKAGR